VAKEIKITEEFTLPDGNLPDIPIDSAFLVLLPINVTEEGAPVYPQSTKSVLKLLRSKELSTKLLTQDQAPLYHDQRSFDWLGPTIFVGGAFLSEKPEAITVALNVISSYLFELFGRDSNRSKNENNKGTAKLNVVIQSEPTKKLKQISYDGPPEGISAIADVLREINE
jgi:hypothetical protein